MYTQPCRETKTLDNESPVLMKEEGKKKLNGRITLQHLMLAFPLTLQPLFQSNAKQGLVHRSA